MSMRRAGRIPIHLVLGSFFATSLVLVTQPVASAAGVSDPPAAPHSIISFPVRDFVSASGYAVSDRPTVEVVRSGVVVGTASNLVPHDDPDTAGFDGIVEVNHPGGGCRRHLLHGHEVGGPVTIEIGAVPTAKVLWPRSVELGPPRTTDAGGGDGGSTLSTTLAVSGAWCNGSVGV